MISTTRRTVLTLVAAVLAALLTPTTALAQQEASTMPSATKSSYVPVEGGRSTMPLMARARHCSCCMAG